MLEAMMLWHGMLFAVRWDDSYLTKGEEQGHVAADALLLQILTGSDALPGRSNLHRHCISLQQMELRSVLIACKQLLDCSKVKQSILL